MKRLLIKTLLASAAIASLAPLTALAQQETIRIGIINHDTGPFATPGREIRAGIDIFRELNGDTVGGRKVEIIYRDMGGPNPATARRLAEELIVRDKVSILGGFYLTSDASPAAAVINQTNTPTVLFVAASPTLLPQSPMFIRVGQNIGQSAVAAAQFALKSGKRKAYVAVSDYAPGHDVQRFFRSAFEAGGGKIVDELRAPLNTVDYAPIAERIKNADIDMLDMFVPPGAAAVSFSKALAAQGVMKQKLVIGMGEAEDSDLNLFDDSIIGFHQALYYAEALDNPENKAFTAALKKKFGADRSPTFPAVSAYDGMGLIYKMIESQKGKAFDAKAAQQAVLGVTIRSPRGTLTIDADTREPVQDIYIRRVDKVNGKLRNVVVDSFKAVKAPVIAN
jgi:branched-chain amino acid transport system substrate-binding protein